MINAILLEHLKINLAHSERNFIWLIFSKSTDKWDTFKDFFDVGAYKG